MPKGLVFLDMRDEVVDSPLVEEFVTKHFPSWRTQKVNVTKMDDKHAIHLIVDEAHLGAEQWQIVVDGIKSL